MDPSNPWIQHQEKRQDGEAWFRTLGLLKLGPGRRDDVLWRKAGMEHGAGNASSWMEWPYGWFGEPGIPSGYVKIAIEKMAQSK